MAVEEVEIDESLHEVLTNSCLASKFQDILIFDLQITRLNHFCDVLDGDLLVCFLN